MSGTITANQYFEFGGLRIDLSKVNTIIKLSVLANGPVQIELTNQIGGARVILNYPESGSFLAALEAYRESLKPKYQFNDGWHICRFKGDVNPPVLRYIKDDVAYDATGTYQLPAGSYDSVRLVDFPPPPLDKFNED